MVEKITDQGIVLYAKSSFLKPQTATDVQYIKKQEKRDVKILPILSGIIISGLFMISLLAQKEFHVKIV